MNLLVSLNDVMTEICDLLKETRQASGLSLEDVAQKTYIKLPYLQALEAGLFEQLPAPVYTYGYIRQYAKLLGLDGGALVARLQNQPFERTSEVPAAQAGKFDGPETELPPLRKRDAVKFHAPPSESLMGTRSSSDAEREAQELMRGADRYVNDVLGKLETEVGKALQIVRNGRQMLKARKNGGSEPAL
jgi:transcriptional regulator with XRE-family HTH domain